MCLCPEHYVEALFRDGAPLRTGMRRLFGVSREQAPTPSAPSSAGQPGGPPTLQQASAKIDAQVQNLEAQIAKLDDEIKTHIAKNKPEAKQRALQCMKKKKMCEQQRDQLIGTQFNVDQMAFAQEQAEITAIAVEAMKVGQAQLKAQQQRIGIAEVEKLNDDIQELQDEMREVNEVLARTSGLGINGADEEELDAEYRQLQEEMAAAALLPEMPAASPAAETPAAQPAAASTAAASTAAPAQAPAPAQAQPSPLVGEVVAP
eukprot:gnl/TRDRNA2_/TRDRNA2_175895_c3_seq1.p1 gnl/TRDRNA2_/TRDRNA2_175895_c3~~gnl/TRDRNA2_/TRDRNA2_175895_c3_seq1.p1  ORF type:complete len:261 (+),score=83.01 gnl/TRDRNA2_/TRDRNA2_175895_c3_seq1:32-814(+)